MANFDDFELAVAAMSGGKNVVKYVNDLPTVMVPFPKFKMSDVITGGSQEYHPAFRVDDVEKDVMYVSKFQNIVMNDRAYSLPGRDPKVNVDFDQALNYCRNNGNGFCLMPYSLWAAVALWCRKNGTMPHGNNNYGADSENPQEKGVPTVKNGATASDHPGAILRTATGSGPATWYHNWMPDGIADLNGNVWEWCAGMRLVDGEIQIIPYANIFDQEISNGASSTFWKAIDKSGNLVAPGTTGTLHWDWISSKLYLATSTSDIEDHGVGQQYQTMSLEDSLTVPELAKALMLYPDEPSGDYGGDYHWFNPTGERLPDCGGAWNSAGDAGVFGVSLNNSRSDSYSDIGFRSAFCDL